MNDAPEKVALGVAGAGATISGATWLAQANQIVGILAGLVAIVAGVYAILHYHHLRSLRKQ